MRSRLVRMLKGRERMRVFLPRWIVEGGIERVWIASSVNMVVSVE